VSRWHYRIYFVYDGAEADQDCTVTMREDMEVDARFRNEWAGAILLERKYEPQGYRMRGCRLW
jgi:hypothetical protein